MSVSQRRKVVVVGAGAVGSTFVYTLAQSGLADEIVVLDRNDDLARGQVLDLAHGEPFFSAVSIRTGDPGDYRDAQLVVITAGAAQRPGETRLDLLQKNATIVRGIVADVVAQDSGAVILMVTNPVDVMTHLALRASGLGRARIIGSGTVLDSARLRYLLAAQCGIDIHNVHAYVLGEHGDSEFAAWSMTHIAGVPIDAFRAGCARCEAGWQEKRAAIEREVRESAYHIIGYKGATWFGVGMALVRIAGAILRGERSMLTVSTLLDGEYGLHDVCLSVPCIVTAHGVERVVTAELPVEEQTALAHSAEVLKKAIAALA